MSGGAHCLMARETKRDRLLSRIDVLKIERRYGRLVAIDTVHLPVVTCHDALAVGKLRNRGPFKFVTKNAFIGFRLVARSIELKISRKPGRGHVAGAAVTTVSPSVGIGNVALMASGAVFLGAGMIEGAIFLHDNVGGGALRLAHTASLKFDRERYADQAEQAYPII